MGKATKKNNCEPKKNNCETKKKTLKNKTNLEQSGGALEELKNVFIEDINDWQNEDNKKYFSADSSDKIIENYIKKEGLTTIKKCDLKHENILKHLDPTIQSDLFIFGTQQFIANVKFCFPENNTIEGSPWVPKTIIPSPDYRNEFIHPNFLGIITTKEFNGEHEQIINDINTKFDYLEEYVKKRGKVHIPRDNELYNDLIMEIQMGLGTIQKEEDKKIPAEWNIQQDLLYYRVAKLCVLTLQDKLDHIEDFLTIYTDTAYNSSKNQRFLPDPIIQSIKKKTIEQMTQDVVLILPRQTTESNYIKDIKNHLLFRHPIHFKNNTNWDWINKQIFTSIFGYTKNLVTRFDTQVRGLRKDQIEILGNHNCRGDARLKDMWYGILGWTNWIDEKDDDDIPKNELDEFRPTKDGAYILHTWGVNLEDTNTPHYKYCFTEENTFNINKYTELLTNTLSVIKNAITYLKTKLIDPKNIIQVRISKLGFGAWKSMIPKQHKSTLLETYKNALLSMHEENQVVIKFVDHPNGTYTSSISKSGKNEWVTNDYDNKGKGIDENGEPKFTADPFGKRIQHEEDTILLLVNAWDDASFIGNGGSRDNTLDGWMVTGCVFIDENRGINGQPLGHYAKNYSYLHNVFFQPQLLNEDHWIWGEGIELKDKVEEVKKVEEVEKVELDPFKHALNAFVDMFDNPKVKQDSPRIKPLNLYERLLQEFEKDKHNYDSSSIERAKKNMNKVSIIYELLNKKEETINELVQIANKIDATDGISTALNTALDNMDAAEAAVAEANAAAEPYLDEQKQAMAARDEALIKKALNYRELVEKVRGLREQFEASDAKQQLAEAEETEGINILQFYKSFNAWVESIKKNMKGVVEDLLDTESPNQMVIDLAKAFDIESKTKRLARKQAEMERAHREEIKSIASGSIAGIDDMRFDIESHKNINLTNYYDILISQAQNMNRPEYEDKINAKFENLQAKLEELSTKPDSTDIDTAIAQAMGVMIEIGKKIKAKILEIMGTIKFYDKTYFEQLNKTILEEPKSFDKSTQEIIAISKVMIKRIRDYNQSSFNEDEEYLNIENMKTMIEILTIKMNANDANEITTLEAKKVVNALQKVFNVDGYVKEPTNFKNPIINNQIFAVAIAKGFTNYENYERILHKHVILKQRKIEMNNYYKLDSDILVYKQLSNNEEKEKMYSSLISRKDEFNDLDYYSGVFSKFNKPIKRAAEEVAEQQVFIIDFLKDKNLEKLEFKDTPPPFQELVRISLSIDKEQPIQEALNDVVEAFYVANVANAAQAHPLEVVAYDKYRAWVELIKTKVIKIANQETWTTDSAKKIIAALLFAFSIKTEVSNYEQFIVNPAEEEPAEEDSAEAERLAAEQAEREQAERLAEAERLAKEAETKYYQNLSVAIARGFNTYKEMNIYKNFKGIYSGYEYYDAYTHIKEDDTIEKITSNVFIEKLTKDIETTTYDIEAVERGIISKPPEYLATLKAKLIMLKTKKLFADNKISGEKKMREDISPDVISVFRFADIMGDKAKEFDDDIKINGPMNLDQRAGLQFNATREAIKEEAERLRSEGDALTIIVAALLSSFKILATISNKDVYEKFIPKQKTQEETQEAYKHDAFAVARGFFTYDEMLSILEDGTIMEGEVKKKYPNIKNYYETILIYVQTTDYQEIDTEIKILTKLREILVELNTPPEHSKDKVMIDAKIEMVSARRNILDGVFKAKEANKGSTEEARNAAIKKAFEEKIEAPDIKDTILIAREIQNVGLSDEKERIQDALAQMNGKQHGILNNSIILGFEKALQLKGPEPEQAEENPAEENPAKKEPAEENPAKKEPAKGGPAKGGPAGVKKNEAQQVQEQAEENPAKKKPAKGGPAGENPAKKEPAKGGPAGENPAKKEPAKGGPAVNPDGVEKKTQTPPPPTQTPPPPQTQSPDQQSTRAILSTILQEETSSSYMFYIPIVGILIAISSVFLIK